MLGFSIRVMRTRLPIGIISYGWQSCALTGGPSAAHCFIRSRENKNFSTFRVLIEGSQAGRQTSLGPKVSTFQGEIPG